MEDEFKTLSSKKIYENPFFGILEDVVQNSDGRTFPYYIIDQKPAVNIIAWDKDKGILLTNQYRYPIRSKIWSLVAGLCQSGDSLEDGKRELKEETGFSAKIWTRLAEVTSASGLTNQICSYYVAEDLTEGEPELEEGERDLTHKFFSVSDVEKMILNGTLNNVFAITGFYYFKSYLENK
jgi:8-oxo-dGTP pyrophosphatase MutT (NUDIX family)